MFKLQIVCFPGSLNVKLSSLEDNQFSTQSATSRDIKIVLTFLGSAWWILQNFPVRIQFFILLSHLGVFFHVNYLKCRHDSTLWSS